MGEVGDGGGARPRDDGHKKNTEDDCTLDAVHHQHHRQETATEDSDPHGRVTHLVRTKAGNPVRIELIRRVDAASEFERRRFGASDNSNTGRIAETDDGEVLKMPAVRIIAVWS